MHQASNGFLKLRENHWEGESGASKVTMGWNIRAHRQHLGRKVVPAQPLPGHQVSPDHGTLVSGPSGSSQGSPPPPQRPGMSGPPKVISRHPRPQRPEGCQHPEGNPQRLAFPQFTPDHGALGCQDLRHKDPEGYSGQPPEHDAPGIWTSRVT